MFDSLFPKHWTTLQRLMWLKTNALARAVYETVTGNPVSFTAKAAPLRQLKVAFSPVQSLNGYDAPWPAGGGTNLLNYADFTTSHRITSVVDNGDNSFTVTASGDGAYINHLVSVEAGQTYNIRYTSAENIDGNAGQCGTATVYDGPDSTYTALLSAASVNTSSGKNFTPTGNVVLVRCIVTGGLSGGVGKVTEPRLTKGSSEKEYSPYSNICPISGWDSLNVEQRGKNLWGKQLANNVYVEFDTVTGEQYTVFAKMIDPEATTYLQLAKAPVGTSTWSSMGYVISGKVVTTRTFTAEDGYKYALWSNASYTNVKELQIELGTTASDYQPYNPSSRSISITIGETVYSGTVDVISGVGEITHKGVDMGSLSWVDYLQQNNAFYAQIPDAPNNTGEGNTPDVYCTIYAKTAAKSNAGWLIFTGNNAVSLGYDSARVYFRDTRFADVAAIGNSLDGVIFVYPLATPIPIQLTPQEVQSLAGDNTMWSNANQPITVEYRKN